MPLPVASVVSAVFASSECDGDANGDGGVGAADVVAAVRAALIPTPTPSLSPTPTTTATPTSTATPSQTDTPSSTPTSTSTPTISRTPTVR